MTQLVVEEYGAFIGKTSERLKVSKGKEVLAEVPLLDLEQVLMLSAGVSLSSDVVRACAERGISINFLSRSGKPYARLMCAEVAGGERTGDAAAHWGRCTGGTGLAHDCGAVVEWHAAGSLWSSVCRCLYLCRADGGGHQVWQSDRIFTASARLATLW